MKEKLRKEIKEKRRISWCFIVGMLVVFVGSIVIGVVVAGIVLKVFARK